MTGDLEQIFEQRFGIPPQLVVRAPGRVNLIGEHTDYNGLPVLPMAIERAVTVIAALSTDDETPLLEIASVDPHYEPRRIPLQAPIPRAAPGDWSNYPRAAAQHLLGDGPLPSLRLLISGDIPAGAGLSSSSALVVAVGLALTALAGRPVDRVAMAEAMAAAERYVGTASGGMDQAASLLGEAGAALRIDFDPLRARPVPLSAEHIFVVAESLVVAEKGGGAQDGYNTRVAECRLALWALEVALGLPRGSTTHLGELERRYPARALSDYLPLLEEVLPPGEASLEELAEGMAYATEALRRQLPDGVRRRHAYAPLPRVRHVIAEAQRVVDAEVALRGGDLQRFGALMNASHESCRDDYGISCPALEELVAVARRSGALGARLTGAGFGGCTVNLLRRADLEGFLADLDVGFYQGRVADAEAHRFVFEACSGATWRFL